MLVSGRVTSSPPKKTKTQLSNIPKKKQPRLYSECNGSGCVTGGRGSSGEDGGPSLRGTNSGAADAGGRDWRSWQDSDAFCLDDHEALWKHGVAEKKLLAILVSVFFLKKVFNKIGRTKM